jgi:hypothetical protein
MEWLGLSGSAFVACALGFGAVVVALYLLREQRRQLVVPALALWEGLLRSRAQAALATRVRRLLSLLIALAILASILFALADLRARQDGGGRAVLILLDRSASMAATDEPGGRLAAAKRAALALIDGLAPGDRALVASLDRGATPLGGWTSDRQALRATLAEIQPSALPGSLLPAMKLALAALRNQSHPELYLISDGNVTERAAAEALWSSAGRVPAHFLRVGQRDENVGVTDFALRNYPLDQSHVEAIVRIENFGQGGQRLRLRVEAGDALVHEEELALAGKSHVVRTLADLVASDQPLRARVELLGGKDFLASDDQARARLPPIPRLRVLVVSPGNRYLEAALLLEDYLDVSERAPGDYRSADGYDVVIFDRFLPASDPAVPALYLTAADSSGWFPLAIAGSAARPFFERVDEQHPSLRQLSLRDVNVARALKTSLLPGDRALASGADKLPLIVEGRRAAPFVSVNFDLRESDFVLRPAWPLFLLRSLDRLAGRGDRLGSSQPDGGRLGDEGAIAPAAQLLVAAERPAKAALPRPGTPEQLWPWFVLAALLLLSVEWLSFQRRWTV